MNERITTYQRLIRSSMAEQIMEQSKIHLDLHVLRPFLIGNTVDKNSDLYKYMKTASQAGGYIQTEYDSKQKTTARMFTKRGCLNLITLNDERILKAMNSRYDDGRMVVLDYKNFEPSIIKSILGDEFPTDLHDVTANILEVPRSVVKKLNMELLYSDNFASSMKKIALNLSNRNKPTNETQIGQYVDVMSDIRNSIDEFTSSIEEMYATKGFIVNSYGRKIYPKNKRNIFNNEIQSIGSEILVEAIIELNNFIQGKDINILFHRFDALYFDISKDMLIKHLGNIINIMESIDNTVNLKVGIQLGVNLSNLEDLDID